MNLDEQRANWQNIRSDHNWDALDFSSRWEHPVLRKIRRQSIFEAVCWALFLALYFSALDGDQKPLGWNLALVIGLFLLIAHSWLGYRLAARPIGGQAVTAALRKQANLLRLFGYASTLLRAAVLLIFFGFILSNVPFLWTTPRIWFLGTIGITVIIQIGIHWWVWRSHSRALWKTIQELEN